MNHFVLFFLLVLFQITKFFQRRLGDHTLLGISSRVLRHEVFQPGGRILSHQPLSSIPVDADDDEFGIHRFSLLKPLAIENLGELGFEDLKIDNALLTSKDWVPADYAELVANPVARSFRRHASTASNSNNDVFTDDVDIPGAAASVTLPGPRPHRMSSMDNTQEILYVKTIKTSSVPKFVQHMAEANMFVNEIRACYMEPLKRAFEARVATLQQRQGTRQGTPEWHAASDAEVKHALMAHFNKSAKLVGSSGSSSNNNSSSPSATSSDHAVRIVLAWHGCSVATARDICQQNFRKLRDRDAGFFGAGLYLTLDPIYAGFYAAGLIGGNMAAPGTGKATGSDAAATAGAVALPPPTRTSETVALLLCAVLVSKVYPVTRSDYKNGKTCKYRGKALERDHDTHIVRVSPDLDFEATNTPAEDDPLEIVVDTDANILPLAQVLFTYSQPDVLL